MKIIAIQSRPRGLLTAAVKCEYNTAVMPYAVSLEDKGIDRKSILALSFFNFYGKYHWCVKYEKERERERSHELKNRITFLYYR